MAQARVKVGEGLGFGLGNMGLNTATLVFTTWVTPRYCPPDNRAAAILPVMWVSGVLLASKILEAGAGLAVGHASDGLRTRWGRRMPFVAAAVLPLCAAFMALWAPPLRALPPHSPGLAMYFAASVLLFWLAYTCVQIPFFSLLPEIAGPGARVTLASYQAAFTLISSGIVFVGAPFILARYGFPALGVIAAAIAFVCIGVTPLLIRENSGLPSRRKHGFTEGIALTLKNPAFVIHIAHKFFSQIGFQMLLLIVPYFVRTILGRPAKFTGLLMLFTGVGAGVSFVFIRRLIRRFDKRSVNLSGLLSLSALMPFVWLLGRFDLSFRAGALVVPETACAAAVFLLLGYPVAVLMAVQPPILADIIDLDELGTSLRREAAYFAVQGVALKIGLGVSGMIVGALFHKFGYTVDAHAGVDISAFAASAFIFVSFLVFLKYPLNRAEELRIREELGKRG